MSEAFTQRWSFTQPSPLGEVHASYELTAEGLRFHSSALVGGGEETLRWDAIAEAATAVVDLPGGRGAPDMPRWMPGRLEWLLIARRDRAGRPFMRPLPTADGEARERLLAGLREHLGARWVGEQLPLQSVQRRFGVSSRGDTLKVAGLVISVLALLFALLMLLAVLSSALFALPAGFVLGGWVFRSGLLGLRDAIKIANTPTARVVSAAMGLVELQGRALTDAPSAAAVSGRPSVWWDAAVDVWQQDSDRKGGEWRQVAARHGGAADTVVLEDATGRVPVWLRDADVLLQEHCWHNDRDELPAPGAQLLAAAGLRWHGGRQRLRVRERRMEAGGPIYVLGTLDEAHHALQPGQERGPAAWARALRTGTWREALLQRLPGPLRIVVAITLSYLELLMGVGRGGERARGPQDAPPPANLGAADPLVWKGRAGRAFFVCDRRETEALSALRKRSLIRAAIGIGILCWCLHEVLKLF